MYEIYDLQEFDTIDNIAKKFNTTKENLYIINGFKGDVKCVPNMQIIVPKKDDGCAMDFWYYTVKKDDNPYSIASQYQVDVNTFLALNGLDRNDYIYPNQTLLIPKEGVTVYFTKDGDTLQDVLEKFHLSYEDLVSENDNIYLCSEQFILFRGK